MVEKYGKEIKMRKIRSFQSEILDNEKGKEAAKVYYNPPIDKEKSICRICKSHNTALYFKAYYNYLYYECKQCGALYLDNLPQITEMYRVDEISNTDTYLDDSHYEKRIQIIIAPKADFVIGICREKTLPINTWLDIGSGGGHLLSYLKKLNIQGYGIESDVRQYEFSKNKGLNVINDFIDVDHDRSEINSLLSNVDVVSMFMVLEHMEHPGEIIDYLYKNMKNGAVLVIEVPRHPSVASFANLMNKDIIYRHISPPNHLQIFSEKSIELLFDNKFELLGKWGFGMGFADIINYLMISSGEQCNDLYDRIMSCSNDVEAIFDTAGLSDDMIFVAAKK